MMLLLKVLTVVSRWDLQLVAIVRSKAGVSHVTWNPFLPCQAAFFCEDGSLHILVVTNQPTDVPQMTVQVSVDAVQIKLLDQARIQDRLQKHTCTFLV